MAKRGLPKKGGQEHLPGAEPMPKNEKVHSAAIRYAEARDERMAFGKEEKGLKTTLTELMLREGLSVYEYGDVRVDLDTKNEIKVKIGSEPEPAEIESNGRLAPSAEDRC